MGVGSQAEADEELKQKKHMEHGPRTINPAQRAACPPREQEEEGCAGSRKGSKEGGSGRWRRALSVALWRVAVAVTRARVNPRSVEHEHERTLHGWYKDDVPRAGILLRSVPQTIIGRTEVLRQKCCERARCWSWLLEGQTGPRPFDYSAAGGVRKPGHERLRQPSGILKAPEISAQDLARHVEAVDKVSTLVSPGTSGGNTASQIA